MRDAVDEIGAVPAEPEEMEGAEGAGSRSRLGGSVVRVCERCMERQRERGADPAVAFVAEELRWRSQGDAAGTRMRVAEVGCMKLCPEDGVAISASGPMGRTQGVVRTAEEVGELHTRLRGEQTGEAGELRGRALRRAQRLAAAAAEGSAE